MKDLTATTFGWIIAYVLPGLLVLYTVSFWSTTISAQLTAFSQAQSTIGLFLLVLLTALLIGLELTAVRWVVFERWLCRRTRLQPTEFASLQSQDKIAAFRTIADEHYKYHQFWGSVTLVIPVFLFGLATSRRLPLCSLEVLGVGVAGLVVEAVTIAAALEAYRRYVDRSRAVLSGG